MSYGFSSDCFVCRLILNMCTSENVKPIVARYLDMESAFLNHQMQKTKPQQRFSYILPQSAAIITDRLRLWTYAVIVDVKHISFCFEKP